MRIDRSWGLCVLIAIALVIGARDVRAQSYPAPEGYQQATPPMQPGMVPGSGPTSMPQYAPGPGGQPGVPAYSPMAALPPGANAGPPRAQDGMMRDSRAPAQPMMPPGATPGAMGAPPASHGPQPAGYYDPAQGAPPQQPSPSPAAPIEGMGPAEYPAMGGAPCPPGAGYDPAFHDPAFYPGEAYASDDFDWSTLRCLLPYGAGGYGAPRWYDASAEWVSLKRDSVGEDTVFSTLGIGPDNPVLGTDQLDFDNESGFRASFAIQLGPGSSLETTYLGLANWASNSNVTSEIDELYSIYSEFGTDPSGGFLETDQASFQGIAYSSDFDTIELNYRRRWAGPNTRLQGSWFYGIRYMQLKEDFQYVTESQVNEASSETVVSTLNSLTGGQLGSSLWLCLLPGLHVGTEARAGLYGNHATQRTTVAVSDPGTESYRAHVTEDSPAFLGDANVSALWRINQQWTLRGGYMFLWMDEVALATDNFDPDVPIFGGDPSPRDAEIDNSSYLFYHGFTAGVEYLW
ncbi:MAG: BBP7 family outer membrane beta-barrel protein [Planctomycetota bacterium]